MVENGGKSVKESVQKSEKTVHLFVKYKQYNKYENWQNIGKETAKNWENNQWKNLWKKQQNNQWKKRQMCRQERRKHCQRNWQKDW